MALESSFPQSRPSSPITSYLHLTPNAFLHRIDSWIKTLPFP